MLKSGKNKGFLLLEVMLTVAILSLGIIFVLRSFGTSLAAVKLSRDIFTADLLLEEKIWQKDVEDRLTGGVMPKDETGEFEEPFERFSYKLEFEEDKNLPGLYEGIFEVSWQQKNEKRLISCQTYYQGNP